MIISDPEHEVVRTVKKNEFRDELGYRSRVSHGRCVGWPCLGADLEGQQAGSAVPAVEGHISPWRNIPVTTRPLSVVPVVLAWLCRVGLPRRLGWAFAGPIVVAQQVVASEEVVDGHEPAVCWVWREASSVH